MLLCVPSIVVTTLHVTMIALGIFPILFELQSLEIGQKPWLVLCTCNTIPFIVFLGDVNGDGGVTVENCIFQQNTCSTIQQVLSFLLNAIHYQMIHHKVHTVRNPVHIVHQVVSFDHCAKPVILKNMELACTRHVT